jgi:hypothetical protein
MKLDADTDRRIRRLIAQMCSNALAARIVGVTPKTVAKVRRRMANDARLRITRPKPKWRTPPRCCKCRNYVSGRPSKWIGLCDDCAGEPKELPEPTVAMPGTSEKVDVYAARVAARLKLDHPEDLGVEVYGCQRKKATIRSRQGISSSGCAANA